MTRFATATRGNLIVAAALAALAALLAAAYVSRTGNSHAATAPSGALVYTAVRDIPVGTAGATALEQHDLVPRRVAVEAVVPDAVTTPAQIEALVALQPILAGEQATTRRFGAQNAQGIRAALTGQLRVIDVSGTRDQLLAGTLERGDHVDVVVSLKTGVSQTAFAKIALHDLLVLEAPTVASSGMTGTQGGASVSVQLTDAQAQRLFFVMKNGDWTFLLRPAAHAANSTSSVESTASILDR